MLIDVTDLQYKTLSFNRQYDVKRYNRGRSIYNGGLALIQVLIKKTTKIMI